MKTLSLWLFAHLEIQCCIWIMSLSSFFPVSIFLLWIWIMQLTFFWLIFIIYFISFIKTILLSSLYGFIMFLNIVYNNICAIFILQFLRTSCLYQENYCDLVLSNHVGIGYFITIQDNKHCNSVIKLFKLSHDGLG